MPFIEQPTINREDEIRAVSGEFKSFEKTGGEHHCICMQIPTKLQQIVESFSCLYTDRQNASETLQIFQATMHK